MHRRNEPHRRGRRPLRVEHEQRTDFALRVGPQERCQGRSSRSYVSRHRSAAFCDDTRVVGPASQPCRRRRTSTTPGAPSHDPATAPLPVRTSHRRADAPAQLPSTQDRAATPGERDDGLHVRDRPCGCRSVRCSWNCISADESLSSATYPIPLHPPLQNPAPIQPGPPRSEGVRTHVDFSASPGHLVRATG